MNLEEEIKVALSLESTKEIWRNDHASNEFKFVKQLGATIGSAITNDRGCKCIERFFMLVHAYARDNEKINLKQKQMESNFKLKEGKLLSFGGSHYTAANITDEVAIRLLKSNESNLLHFDSYPENWKELIGVKEVSDREKELLELELADLFAIAQEIADEKELKMVGARSKEKKVIKFILDNE